jgi:hypothetical protein
MTYKNRLSTKRESIHITSDDDAALRTETTQLIKKQVILVHTLRQTIAACERQEPHALILAMIGDMLDMDESAQIASDADPAGVAQPPSSIGTEESH